MTIQLLTPDEIQSLCCKDGFPVSYTEFANSVQLMLLKKNQIEPEKYDREWLPDKDPNWVEWDSRHTPEGLVDEDTVFAVSLYERLDECWYDDRPIKVRKINWRNIVAYRKA